MLVDAYDNRCAYCFTQPPVLTADHIVPVANGGSASIDNIAPACPTCNASNRALKWAP
jgi:5-methylcytosine-specific restriction endonuclease McrA